MADAQSLSTEDREEMARIAGMVANINKENDGKGTLDLPRAENAANLAARAVLPKNIDGEIYYTIVPGSSRAKGGLIKKKKMRHGGVHTKRPQMMNGGVYKGKSHSYAAGGKVIDMKIIKE